MAVEVVTISTESFDIDGTVVLRRGVETSQVLAGARRVQRTATLDGSVVVVDNGYAEGDRTFRVDALVTQAQQDDLWAMFKNYNLLLVSVRDGLFSCNPQDFACNHGELTITLLVKEKIA